MGGRRGRVWTIGVLLVWLALGTRAAAGPLGAPPRQDPGGATVAIGYQGVLTDRAGVPVSGTLPMEFRLYSAASGGVTHLWTSGLLDVPVEEGLFAVALDVPQGILNGRALWLAMYVDGETLSPRQPLLAVPYAAGIVPGGRVEGSTATHTLAAANLSTGAGLWGSSVRGAGVYGLSDRGYGVYGECAGEAAGYGGYFASATGVGVYGRSDGAGTLADPHVAGVQGVGRAGYGVYGASEAAGRAGVLGASTDGAGVRGESVRGAGLEGASTSGPGLRAASALGSGAEIESTEGTALVAATAGTGAAAHAAEFRAVGGAAVEAQSSHNAGVRAGAGDVALAPDFDGLGGVVGRGETVGVYGASREGTGVEGASVGGYGVRGASQGNYGGYFTSTGQRALYAENLDGTYYDAYFGGEVGIRVEGGAHIVGDLTVGGAKTGYLVDIALHAGDVPLVRGDLVEVVGVTEPVVGDIPVPRVRRVVGAESRAVLGVVDRRWAPGEGFAPPEGGPVAPGEYVGIVTIGAYARVRADATYGAIAPGDLLVSSPTPGHAMRAGAPAPGTVVGKALEGLEAGRGVIAVLVTLG
jgi:hypothetical protein